jgi:endonuclease/exonuclease/phosphatase (EEP) superfamily protein YafD
MAAGWLGSRHESTARAVGRRGDILASHDGPVILAGGFNTWSTARRRAVDAIALRLGLQAVSLEPDERSRFLGEPVDQIYYRGLVPSAAMAVPVSSSDHKWARPKISFAWRPLEAA